MANGKRVYLVCDGCGADDLDGNGTVQTHRLRVDDGAWEIDACAKCWRTTYRERIRTLTRGVRTVRVRRRRAA